MSEDHRATLLIPPASDFSLREVERVLREWDWRPPINDAPPGDTQPDRIEQDAEDGRVRVAFGDWCMWVDRVKSESGTARAVIATDPEPEELPRGHFPSDEAYYDYLHSLTNYEFLFQSALNGLLERFPEVIGFYHCDSTDVVGSRGVWWTRDAEATPPPAHLTGWLDRTQIQEDTYYAANVRCPCGCERVEICYPGATHVPRNCADPIPCTVKLPDRTGYDAYWFGLKVICTACRRECELFDSKLHGWDAFIAGPAHRAREAKRPRSPLVPWTCLQCGTTAHVADIHLQLQTPEKFLNDTFEDTGMPFPPSQRADCFGWFGMSIRCCGCNHPTDDWAGYETR